MNSLIRSKSFSTGGIHYLQAALLVAAAYLMTRQLQSHLGESISPFFFAAVMLSAWTGGWGPGLLATILAGWCCTTLFANPSHQHGFGWDDFIRLVVFLMVSVLISFLTSVRKRAELALRDSYDQLEHRVVERTTELQTTNKKLHESEERFRLLVEGVSDYAIVMLDRTGNVASWNSGAEHIFGYAQDQIQNRNVSSIMRVNSSEVDRQLQDAAKSGRHEEEAQRCRADGSLFWANVITTALRDEKGNLRGYAQVTRDVTERRKLERQVLDVSETELRRIGHDLHDGLGQELTGVAFLTQNLENRIIAEKGLYSADANRILALVNSSIEKVRDFARSLSPVEIGPDGLQSALRELTRTAEKLFNIECTFKSTGMVHIDDDAAALPMYRIAQEAINNAIRHGKTRRIQVELCNKSGEIVLTIQNDGIGFSDTTRSTDGMGIRVMNYRARMMGANLEICNTASGTESGTLVTCRLHQGVDSKLA